MLTFNYKQSRNRLNIFIKFLFTYFERLSSIMLFELVSGPLDSFPNSYTFLVSGSFSCSFLDSCSFSFSDSFLGSGSFSFSNSFLESGSFSSSVSDSFSYSSSFSDSVSASALDSITGPSKSTF